jgi:hypothetical protein
MSLQEEIDQHRKEIHTDAYQMSIGEIVNLYREGDLDIHPEFQRFYRWTPKQKSRWIESILLGIPLPSIFVAQRPDGVWDVIDGLQRLSTILETMGELKDDSGKKARPLLLEETRLLPSMAGKRWSGSESSSLTDDQRRFIKRAKLDVKIILRESHESSKYEIFRRLNTGGSFLSDQELRSAFLLGANKDFYRWINVLAHSRPFMRCLPLSENQRDQQYDLELVVRFLVFRTMPVELATKIDELGEFLTDNILAAAADPKYPKREQETAFHLVFDLLSKALGEDSFRKYDPQRDRFLGAFLISAFEVVALGIGFNFRSYRPTEAKAVAATIKQQLWSRRDFLTSSGVRATQRLPRTLALGRDLFAK